MKNIIRKDLKTIIPMEYRNNLSNDIVIARGLDNCLFLYNENDWEVLLSNLNNHSKEKMTKDMILLADLFVKGARKIKMNKNGRIIIPGYLLEYANIKESITFKRVNDVLIIKATEEFEKK